MADQPRRSTRSGSGGTKPRSKASSPKKGRAGSSNSAKKSPAKRSSKASASTRKAPAKATAAKQAPTKAKDESWVPPEQPTKAAKKPAKQAAAESTEPSLRQPGERSGFLGPAIVGILLAGVAVVLVLILT